MTQPAPFLPDAYLKGLADSSEPLDIGSVIKKNTDNPKFNIVFGAASIKEIKIGSWLKNYCIGIGFPKCFPGMRSGKSCSDIFLLVLNKEIAVSLADDIIKSIDMDCIITFIPFMNEDSFI